MPKRVFIIHGWSGYPEECWFIWLKEELASRGFEAYVPQMPDTDNPSIGTWVPFLKKLVGEPDEETYFVGHSIGCQTILRYLESIDKKVGGALFVAGWFDLENLETKEEEEIAKEWVETPIDFIKAKKNCGPMAAILSDNDPFGALKKNADTFQNKLDARLVLLHDKGHMGADVGMTELPEALEEFLKIAR